MRLRIKRTWITVMVLALSAEGAALAQSQPARAGGAGDPVLARVAKGSAAVGPELEAARASLGGKAKKGDTPAPVDLNSLANRQSAADSTVASGLVLPSAGAPIQSTAAGGDGLQMLHGDATGAASTTAGSATRVVPDSAQDAGGSSSVAAPHAEAVIRGQINPAAKSCYENDPDAKSKRPGRLVVLIKITPAGEVDSVTVSNNIGLTPSVASCITTAARAAKFAAPGANGATVRAAFSFAGRDDQAPPAAVRAAGPQAANASGHAARGTIAKADTQPVNGETAHR